MKIKEYETAARPKSRNRKRHSPPSTSRSREGGERGSSIVHRKAKKKFIRRRRTYTGEEREDGGQGKGIGEGKEKERERRRAANRAA